MWHNLYLEQATSTYFNLIYSRGHYLVYQLKVGLLAHRKTTKFIYLYVVFSQVKEIHLST